VVAPTLEYRAGPRARRRIREEGLGPATIRAWFGPASGPRWIALTGIDHALIDAGLLAGCTRLAGASAGAWRALAHACPDPHAAHRALLDRYIGQRFSRADRPPSVSRAYRTMLGELFGPHAPGLVAHPAHDIVIHTARLRGPRPRPFLVAALLVALALHRAAGRGTRVFFERVAFDSRPARPLPGFRGSRVPLTAANLVDAALASGTVPLYLQAVRDPAGAPRGAYVDGGLTDYHLNQRYLDDESGVLLLVHYQRAIVPRWMDRRPAPLPDDLTADVLLVHPSPAWVAALPDARLPDRDDFFRFMDAPAERMWRWREAALRSAALGEAFARDQAAGCIPERLEPL
jgi:hypothetical protein